MAEEGACPICGFERLQTDHDKCPQCDADLTCFKVLDSIPEELPPPVSEPSSIVAIQREPSIASLEQEESPVSVSNAKPESIPESSATNSVSSTPDEKIMRESETPSSKRESKHSIPDKPSSGLKKRLIPKGASWNYAAAMLTFAVILIAVVAVFQLYHLRRLKSDLKERSQTHKIVLKNEHQKRSPEPVSSESLKANQPKADSTPVVKKVRPTTASKLAKSYSATQIKKIEKQSEFSESKETTAKTLDDNDKSTSLPEPKPMKNMPEPKTGKKLSEHDFQTITIKAGDTLKSIAKTHYGSAKYYPLLIMLNPDMRIDLKGVTGSLKIINDHRKAAAIYREKTSKIGNRLYFSYTIIQGDTLKTIALKFYRSKRMIKSILDLNPDSRFRAGEQIKIRLE